MIILGLNIAEACSAALMRDGRIVAAAEEERLVGQKGWSGFPEKAVGFCLQQAGLKVSDVDQVAVDKLQVSNIALLYSYVQRRSSFQVADYVKEAHHYWYPLLYENRQPDYLEVFSDKLQKAAFPPVFTDEFLKHRQAYQHSDLEQNQNLRRKLIRAFLPEIAPDKIHFYPHHENHAFYGYYGSPLTALSEPVHVITADSFGDYENATIGRFDKGHYELLHTVNNHNLGRLFRNMTLLLGMKPYEHEYKVMGLAPYAKAYIAQQAYAVFDQTMQVRGLDFVYDVQPPDNYFWFKDKLEGIRFDGIAAGLQRYLEDRMTSWITNAISAFGIRHLIFSGGLAVNIKLNLLLSQFSDINSFFVPASPDDSANAIGVCFRAMSGRWGQAAHQRIKPLSAMYLGPSVEKKEVDAAIARHRITDFCDIKTGVDCDFIAGKLARGMVIGRCCGPMEFGARALGNRSILADPRDPAIIDRINQIIKKRDFWMPFAPVILEPYWWKYLVSRNQVYSPFMTIGFQTTAAGQKALAAGLHSADKTTRPQMLKREINPEYYRLVEAFEKQTGVGALLNTSFNLHGSPIVAGPREAMPVFIHSDLDALLLEDVYIEKTPRRAEVGGGEEN